MFIFCLYLSSIGLGTAVYGQIRVVVLHPEHEVASDQARDHEQNHPSVVGHQQQHHHDMEGGVYEIVCNLEENAAVFAFLGSGVALLLEDLAFDGRHGDRGGSEDERKASEYEEDDEVF